MKLKPIGAGIAAIALISISAAAKPTAEQQEASQPTASPKPAAAKKADPPAPESAAAKKSDPPAPESAAAKKADPPAPESAAAKKAEPPSPKSAAAKKAEPPSSGPVFGPVALTGVTFVGAGIIIGAVAGGFTLSRKKDLQEVCTIGDGDDCPPTYHDDRVTALNTAHVSTAGFILAGVGVATGLVGLLFADKPTESKTGLTPLLGPGHIGIRGSF